MSRTSIYNRNYPGKKIDKGTMLTHDGLKIVHQYMNQALTSNMDGDFSARIAVLYFLNMCMDHFIRVSNTTDITYIKDLVNSYMSDHENGNCEALKLVCSFTEAILFKADRYSGFNNYKWSNEGSNLWHNDHPNKYNSDRDYAVATENQRNPKYMSQKYHRIYY